MSAVARRDRAERSGSASLGEGTGGAKGGASLARTASSRLHHKPSVAPARQHRTAPPDAGGNRSRAAAELPGTGALKLFWTFLLFGVSAFGTAMLQTLRSGSVERGWLSQQEIDEAMGVVQLYPGAVGVDLAAFIGYRLKRTRGALVATAGLLAPSLILVLVGSWAYFTYGARPEVRDIVVGLDALVVGVLVSVTVELAAEHAHAKLPAVIALGAFALGVGGFNVLWAVLGAFVLGALALRGPGHQEPARGAASQPLSLRRLALVVLPGLVVVAGAATAAVAPGKLAGVTAEMAKVGSIAFGNGTVILPVLQQDAVGHHWVTLSQFGTGIALGQVTPGPVLTTAAFVGFAAAGWWGGVAAGVAVFAPSVALTVVAGEVYPYLRGLSWVRGAIAGVLASFTGLLASMALVLARPLLTVPAAVGLAAAAFVSVRVLRLNTLVVFVAGLAIWGLYLVAGGQP
ncbi:MAG: chromate transporter [Acidimicrobiales bacterium]